MKRRRSEGDPAGGGAPAGSLLALSEPIMASPPRKDDGARRGRRRVLLFASGLALLAFTLQAQSASYVSPLAAPVVVPWFALTVAFAAVHLSETRFQVGRHFVTLSLSEVPLIAGLFLIHPAGLVGAAVAGMFAGLLLSPETTDRVKVLFNLAFAYLSTVVAVFTFHAILQGADPMTNRGRLAAIVATAVVSALTVVLIAAAIRVSGGDLSRADVRVIAIGGVGSAVVNATLGLVSVTIIWVAPDGAWLLVGLTLLFGAVHRGYDHLRTRHESMARLQTVTRDISAAVEPDALVAAMLGGARGLLNAEAASLVLHGGNVLTMVEPETSAPQLEAATVLQVIRERAGVIIPRSTNVPELRALLNRSGLPNAVIVPIAQEGELLGALVVGRRATDERDFNGEDLRLLELLGTHGGVALVNSRLVGELRRHATEREHEALHDGLTGLPNRAWFKDQLTGRLEAPTTTAAVMLMDLNGFKEVNDTLGHHSGDVLLCVIAERLQRALAGTGTIARLGGDEFAMLLPDVGGEIAAIGAARQLLSVLEEPISIEGSQLHVTASIGIALAPQHGEETVSLLRHADVAMYAAKSNYSGVEIYRASKDPYSPERLALVSELRTALDAGDLSLAYQPKADLRTGKVVGVEALARWHHPERGYIPPDEFITIAERTGLIAPLTLFVLGEALRQSRTWRLMGLDLAMAVNLSLRSIAPDLPRTVSRLLDETGVSARALTLEITETAIMIDVQRTQQVLNDLAAMGVSLSIDDFGTGYSSLAYLKRLPVTELKVDRSFVMNMTQDDSDATIVRSTVDLARNLGLRVVAEGVEDAAAWSALAHLGCDLAQGYYLSPPLKPEEIAPWCDQQRDSQAARRTPVRVRRGLPAES